MVWIVLIVLFMFGAAVGSFINVVIERTIKGVQWVTGRSRCDHCHKTIPWYDNIPVVSYLVLGGKCRWCHKPIAPQHLVIEVLTGLLFVWWYVIGFTFFQLAQSPALFVQRGFWLIVGILLLVIVVTDWLYYQIPLYATIPLTGLSVGYRLYLSLTSIMRWEDFWLALPGPW